MLRNCKKKWSNKVSLYALGLAGLISSCQKAAIDPVSSKEKYNSENFVICTDRNGMGFEPIGNITSGVSIRSTYWENGSVLRVKFVKDATRGEALKKDILAHANTWTQYANIQFRRVGENEEADIVIDFTTQGAYSAVGTDSRKYAQSGESSMQLGQLKNDSKKSLIRATVLHEFGHALGLMHEQHHRKANIDIDKLATYYYNTGVAESLEKAYSLTTAHFSPNPHWENSVNYDSHSVMHYWLPAVAASNGIGIDGYKTALSAGDIDFIKAVYPFPPRANRNNDLDIVYIIKNDRGQDYVHILRNKRSDYIYAFKHRVNEPANARSSAYTILPSTGDKSRQYTFTSHKLPYDHYQYVGKHASIAKGGQGVAVELIEMDKGCKTSVLFSENYSACVAEPSTAQKAVSENPRSSVDLLLDIYDDADSRYVSVVRDLRDGTLYTYKHPLNNPVASRQKIYTIMVGTEVYRFNPASLPDGYHSVGIKSLPLSRGGRGGVLIDVKELGKYNKVLFFEK